MDRRLALVLLLLSLFALVIGGGLRHARTLQRASADTGPHALLRDGQGGFLLATRGELLHLDAGGAVRDRHAAAGLGLVAIDAIAAGEGATLWLHERGRRRLFRCDTTAWTCHDTGAVTPGLDARLELAWLYGRDRRLLATDSAAQRLLTFDAEGQPLPLPAQAWRAPQQLSTAGGEVLLAEAGARRIVNIDPVANQPGATALETQAAPMRFLRRDSQWWVLEGGAPAPLRLRHYRSGIATDISLPARDPVALLDGGRAGLLLASRDDWRLLALDAETGEVSAFGAPALQQEFLDRARARARAQAALSRLPWVVLPLAALTLLPVPLLLRQRWRTRRVAAPGAPSTSPATASSIPLPAARRCTVAADRVVRIDTRPDLRLEARRRQERRFRWLLWGAGLLLLMTGLAGALWPPLRGSSIPWAVATGLVIMPLLLAGLLVAMRRQEDRLYDRHLVCGPAKVVLVVAGKPLVAVNYDAIWLGEHSLVLGQLRLPLYLGRGALRRPVWDLTALEVALAPRLPAGRRLDERALGRALLAQGQWQGLLILVQRLPFLSSP